MAARLNNPFARTSLISGLGSGVSRGLRFVVEAAVCLTLAVSLFRTFVAQGYMIETGSMAPTLWGYHRRATCPSCGTAICVSETRTDGRAFCPNCGRGGIDLEHQARDDGDQLLVNRAAFDFKSPHRWGVVVFRNPSKPAQAFVKRLAGLPNETLQIIQGDLYINGEIQTKPLAVRRSLQIPVFDQDHLPNDHDPDWQPRWVIEPGTTGWQEHGSVFGFDDLSLDPTVTASLKHPQSNPPPPTSKTLAPQAGLRYRHWIRRGGRHATSVPVRQWPIGVPATGAAYDQLRYDDLMGVLVCTGALPKTRRDELLHGAPAEFQQAVHELYEASHLSPIRDVYGYNGGMHGEGGQREVRDLALSLTLNVPAGQGEVRIGISDGTEQFEACFDFANGQVRLIQLQTGLTVRTGPLTCRHGIDADVELSLMDRQVLVAVDQVEPFAAYSYQATSVAANSKPATPWRPVWISAAKVQARVSHLKLWRDVYYTEGEGPRSGSATAVKLGPDEYFVLGDNSPVSMDSRCWPAGERLSAGLILGQPFLVHLPSVRQRVSIGGRSTDIRIPDISRIRYIR